MPGHRLAYAELQDTKGSGVLKDRSGRPASKRKTDKNAWIRFILQLLFFVFIPSAYSAAFAGVRNIFVQIGSEKSIEFTSFTAILILLLAYTVIFGRFFCGYACAFGSLGDWIYSVRAWICLKLGRKAKAIPEKIMSGLSYIKYANLILIALFCTAGIYEKAHGFSPWEVFSGLRAFTLDAAGYKAGIAILLLIIIGMAAHERFFCRVLCPMGAVFAILPVLPFLSLRRSRSECIKGCRACSSKCPASVELPADGSWETSSDCFQCGKCTGTCPKSNIHCGIKVIRGNEIWFTILRAALLAILMVLIGI